MSSIIQIIHDGGLLRVSTILLREVYLLLTYRLNLEVTVVVGPFIRRHASYLRLSLVDRLSHRQDLRHGVAHILNLRRQKRSIRHLALSLSFAPWRLITKLRG